MRHAIFQPSGPVRVVLAVAFAALLLAAAPITATMTPDIAMPILGRTVYGASGDTVGRLVDVLVDAAGLPQAAVLDVGGFLGLGNRVIAVHWSTLRFHPSDKDHPITIDMPADEIKAAPEYNDTTAPAQVVVPHATPPSAAAMKAPVAIPLPDAAAPAPAKPAPAKPAPAPPTPAPPTPAPAPPAPAPPAPAPPAPSPAVTPAGPDTKK
jgi:hypothetical protein